MIELSKILIEGFCSISSLELALNSKGITIIKAPNGFGKAQPLNEPVLTEKGWKRMGDLTLDDKVINPVTGLPIKILRITDRGELPIFRVTFSDKTHTRCADDHLWGVYKSGKTQNRLRVLDTKTLYESYKKPNKSKPGTYEYIYSTPLTKPIQFSNKELPIHPYVLGFILGDGCISGNRSIVRVSTHLRDWEEVVGRLRSYLPSPDMVHVGTESRGNTKHFRIHGLGDQLRDLGLIGCKSSTKFIPAQYLRSSVEDRRLLLAGLLDTDGNSGSKKKKSKVSGYSSKSKALRDGVVDLVRSLGGISVKGSNIRYKYGRYTKSYYCSIRLPYIPFLRSYKVDEFGEFTRRNRMVNTIREIKPIGTKPCRCITVDSPEGLYITRDYIVTHNSTIFAAVVWALYGKNLKGISYVNTWKKYRNKDYHGTKVEIYFKPSDGRTRKVIRCQEYTGEVEGAKGANRLIYMVDAEPVKNKTKSQIQSLIDKDLEMSYNLFINSIMFGQGMKRLIQETGADKKNLFEEIFELEYLSKARKLAQEKYSDLSSKVYELEEKEKHYSRTKDQLKETNDDLKESSANYLSVEKEKEKELLEQKKLATMREKKVSALVNVDELKSINSKIKSTRDSLKQYRASLDKAKRNTGISLEDFINELIELLEGNKYAQALSRVKSVKERFISVEKYKEKVMNLSEKIEEYEKKQRIIQSNLTLLEKYQEDIERIDKRLAEKKNTPDFSSMIKKNRTLIREYKDKLEKIKSELLKYKKAQDLYKWAYTDPLGNNGIKAFLFESSLNMLNEVLLTYSEILGFNIQFRVDLNSARKDFVTLISKDGIDTFYEELSGGEKQLANLAMAFAMNEVMTNAKGVNLAFLDEVFESLSADNIEIVVGLIRKIYKDKTLFLITHHDSLPIPNAKILRVRKEKGLSYYEF